MLNGKIIILSRVKGGVGGTVRAENGKLKIEVSAIDGYDVALVFDGDNILECEKGKAIVLPSGFPFERAEVVLLKGGEIALFGKANGAPEPERITARYFARKAADRKKTEKTSDNEPSVDTRVENWKKRERLAEERHEEKSFKSGEAKTENSQSTPPQTAEFFRNVKSAIDEMFVCYPEETELKKLIPESEWVRIDQDDGYYVLGVIRTDGVPTYICYGLPSVSDVFPPDELKSVCEWIPDPEREGTGYWLVFQDATTGETLQRIE